MPSWRRLNVLEDDGRPCGLAVVSNLDVSNALEVLQKDNGRANRHSESSQPVWAPWGSTSGIGHRGGTDIKLWYSVPEMKGDAARRAVHEAKLASIAAAGSRFSNTPPAFLDIERELRQLITVSLPGQRPMHLLSGFELSHVQATRMEPGDSIQEHVDKAIYGDIIGTVIVSGTSVVTVGSQTLELSPGDAYILWGEYRAEKKHGVKYDGPVRLPNTASHASASEPRYSLTFRFRSVADIEMRLANFVPRLLSPGQLVEALHYEKNEKYPSAYPAIVLVPDATQMQGGGHDTALSWVYKALSRDRPAVPLPRMSSDEPHCLVLYLNSDLLGKHAPDEDHLQIVPTSSVLPLPLEEGESAMRYFLMHQRPQDESIRAAIQAAKVWADSFDANGESKWVERKRWAGIRNVTSDPSLNGRPGLVVLWSKRMQRWRVQVAGVDKHLCLLPSAVDFDAPLETHVQAKEKAVREAQQAAHAFKQKFASAPSAAAGAIATPIERGTRCALPASEVAPNEGTGASVSWQADGAEASSDSLADALSPAAMPALANASAPVPPPPPLPAPFAQSAASASASAAVSTSTQLLPPPEWWRTGEDDVKFAEVLWLFFQGQKCVGKSPWWPDNLFSTDLCRLRFPGVTSRQLFEAVLFIRQEASTGGSVERHWLKIKNKESTVDVVATPRGKRKRDCSNGKTWVDWEDGTVFYTDDAGRPVP